MAASYPPPASGVWSADFCGCFEDPNSCVCAYCCPCVVVGQLVEIIDQGTTSCGTAGCLYCLLSWVGVPCLYSCGYRGRLRAKYGLPPAPCGDCCTDCWLPWCSLSQQYRELQHRGIDPALGWQHNRVAYEQAPSVQKMGY